MSISNSPQPETSYGRISPTTLTIARVLRNIGLVQRGDGRQFSVKKYVERGEVRHTYVVLFGTQAEELVTEFRQQIEEATRDLGWPFTVRTDHGYVDLSNR